MKPGKFLGALLIGIALIIFHYFIIFAPVPEIFMIYILTRQS